MELFDDLDAAYGAHEFEAWEPRNRNKKVGKNEHRTFAANTRYRNTGPRSQAGEWRVGFHLGTVHRPLPRPFHDLRRIPKKGFPVYLQLLLAARTSD